MAAQMILVHLVGVRVPIPLLFKVTHSTWPFFMFPLKLAPVFFIKCPESPGVFMNRFCSCPFPVLAAVCCLTVLFLGGCSNKEGFIISDPSPEFISPPCPDLNGSVAVVVRPSSELASGYENVPAELNRFLHVRISMDVTRFRKRKREQISLIPPDRLLDVYGKIDSKTDFLEVGKALGADQSLQWNSFDLSILRGRIPGRDAQMWTSGSST